MLIEFRQATRADIDFLDEMHALCMKEHVIKLYPWNEQLFRQTFNPEQIQIVLLYQFAVGMVQVAIRQEELYLANILVTPAFQNLGIGTQIIEKVIALGTKLRLPVKLHVLKYNRARRLYERLGFTEIGEIETHYVMMRG